MAQRIERLKENPRPMGVHKLEGQIPVYRIRQGDVRILYEIHDGEVLIVVVMIEARGSVYGKKAIRSVKARARR